MASPGGVVRVLFESRVSHRLSRATTASNEMFQGTIRMVQSTRPMVQGRR